MCNICLSTKGVVPIGGGLGTCFVSTFGNKLFNKQKLCVWDSGWTIRRGDRCVRAGPRTFDL